MKRADKGLRVWLSSWKKMRRVVPGKKGESVAQYFERITKGVENEV